jgi:NADPH2:quinone reductase
VRIKVEAFGLNRSEYHLRAGFATNAVLPIVPGIEAAGTVDTAPGEEFASGQKVVAMMGGMGREYNGGYAEYTMVPATSVVPGRDHAGLGDTRRPAGDAADGPRLAAAGLPA